MQNKFSTLSDEKLCEEDNISEAFRELELRYLWLIRLKASSLMHGDLYDVEDVMQEGLLGLYNATITYKQNDKASFKTYAEVCITNHIKNELRRRLNKSNSLLTNSVSLDEVQFSVPSPEGQLEIREDFDAVLNQIHISLSPLEQKILALYLSGCKRSQIPVRYGISVKAFDNAIQRVRRKLKAKDVV